MQKYTGKYWMILAPLVKKSLKKHYGNSFAADTMKKAKAEYKAMLNRVDDIGADNPMASNIYMSFIFFAVYRAANGRITVDALRTIAHEAIEWKPLRCMGMIINANKPGGIRAIRKMMLKNAEWLERHPMYKKVSWDFNFDETKHRDGYCYHFTQCPLNNFARREGLLDVLPVMCDMDFLTAGLMHAKLHREHTLAGGGKICDYWYVGDKMKNPR
ncbi:MAG: L-2-amino-thiazoline-4-carboxylic acid hydrolase [Oscillospiraceae bacterium]|nr:L-2-amino-thiazoline-4-carboxylic acid hydrolase [Oscillospiraceae bacterium]MBR3448595.1 L-2-amino-thiazoline-4-carboxylic acid hydrolase [Oscillospiraceae bacterium]